MASSTLPTSATGAFSKSWRGPWSDFNGDGKPDYVLYNASTRRTAVWYLNNNVFLSSAYGPTLPAGWTLVDAADFNRNGETDYALFNPSTRQTAIWYLSGVAFRGGAFGPTLPSYWALVAVGDFDGDCSPDLCALQREHGPNGGVVPERQRFCWAVTSVRLSRVSGEWWVWRILMAMENLITYSSMGDTRQSAIWYLSGVTFAGGAFGPTIAGGYQLTGAADFNGDGSPDYVLYNPSIQRTAIWYMNNNVLLSGSFGPTLPGAWNLVAP